MCRAVKILFSVNQKLQITLYIGKVPPTIKIYYPPPFSLSLLTPSLLPSLFLLFFISSTNSGSTVRVDFL